jgi:hypothetical protein
MSKKAFEYASIGVAICFTVIFCFLVIPALITDFDIVGAFAAGFVNPYSSGYSADVILCWVALVIWIIYEAKVYSIKYGWVCIVLGLVPGVAVGFPLYLVLRNRQMQQKGPNG